MYTRILVPLDGSLFAEQLITPASKVAQASGAELALLRVIERDDAQDSATAYVEALDRDVKKDHERPSIGVLLCASKDDEVVEYALARTTSSITRTARARSSGPRLLWRSW